MTNREDLRKKKVLWRGKGCRGKIKERENANFKTFTSGKKVFDDFRPISRACAQL